MPSSDKKFKSEEFIESSNEEDEEGKEAYSTWSFYGLVSHTTEDDEAARPSSSNKRSRCKDDSELVELSEGSHDESEAEMSGSDEDDDDD